MKYSLYIETSVVSYLTGRLSRNLIVAAHQQLTRDWWDNSLPHFQPFISPVVLDEASKGDKEAAALRLDMLKTFPILEITPGIAKLADAYYSSLQIPQKAKADTYHMAIATWHNVDFLVTWNCKHIANGLIIKKLKELNLQLGTKSPVICTPEELMEVSND
ncbi:MAG: type II toxin-antitoxin system VapC family toxin [bacterium]|nr:type II toxin-antitoxin system VapC family toxin [bacterium]